MQFGSGPLGNHLGAIGNQSGTQFGSGDEVVASCRIAFRSGFQAVLHFQVVPKWSQAAELHFRWFPSAPMLPNCIPELFPSCQTACQLRAIFASQGATAGEIMCDFRQPGCRCRGKYVRFSQARVQALGKLCAIFASLGAGAGGNYVRFSRARVQALGKLRAIFASLGAGAGEIMCDFCQPGSWGNYVGFVATRPQAPLESLELSGGDAQAVCELRGSRAGDLFAQGRRDGVEQLLGLPADALVFPRVAGLAAPPGGACRPPRLRSGRRPGRARGSASSACWSTGASACGRGFRSGSR